MFQSYAVNASGKIVVVNVEATEFSVDGAQVMCVESESTPTINTTKLAFIDAVQGAEVLFTEHSSWYGNSINSGGIQATYQLASPAYDDEIQQEFVFVIENISVNVYDENDTKLSMADICKILKEHTDICVFN